MQPKADGCHQSGRENPAHARWFHMRDLIWEVMVQVQVARSGRIEQHAETPKRLIIPAAATISRTEGAVG